MMVKNCPLWLKNSIFYEVYPQSFLDTNGDGIGDLPGVIEKLDYIQSLGCNAIWLNPCFVSPFGDAGYDVSDYRKVDPRFGSNRDLIRLFKEAHQRGMKVTLDLVAGHTSIEHPWFKASAKASTNRYTNWYVWTDSAWTESTSEMPLIRGFSDRNAAYLPNFFYFQPALNFGFQNPDPQKPWQLPTDHPDVLAVREEMKDIMRYWMDLGADGFRVDMAASLVKADPDRVGTIAFWQDVRAMFDQEYPECVLIAEWSFPRHALQAGFHMDFMIHFNTDAYTSLFRDEQKRDSFDTPGTEYGHSFFDREGLGDICRFLRHYVDHFEATREQGYISLPTGNHDLSRIRCHRSQAELKVIYAFLWSMPGIPYLYYGDEIGMSSVDGLSSKEGAFGRAASRTPMQWDEGRNAGFSTAKPEKLYLPLDPAKNRPSVAKQETSSQSLLSHVRALSTLRLAHPALGSDGGFKVIYGRKNRYPFVYLRYLDDEHLLVAVNPCAAPQRLKLPHCYTSIRVLKKAGVKVEKSTGAIELVMAGISYAIYEVVSPVNI
ncbi:alpha-amylase family glycosyl hydrolase [Kiritimatiellota bacterium B12222]|nr:alpha-amylase family glycosyl hydrolase [Kiritimatiellota bacterium B12222]